MIVMEVARNDNVKKRKRKPTADDNDCSQAPTKAAKIHEEKKKKSFAKRSHTNGVGAKSDLKNGPKKSKPMKKIMRTDENKRKPKTVRNVRK